MFDEFDWLTLTRVVSMSPSHVILSCEKVNFPCFIYILQTWQRLHPLIPNYVDLPAITSIP